MMRLRPRGGARGYGNGGDPRYGYGTGAGGSRYYGYGDRDWGGVRGPAYYGNGYGDRDWGGVGYNGAGSRVRQVATAGPSIITIRPR
jgi:hypothetical protein